MPASMPAHSPRAAASAETAAKKSGRAPKSAAKSAQSATSSVPAARALAEAPAKAPRKRVPAKRVNSAVAIGPVRTPGKPAAVNGPAPITAVPASAGPAAPRRVSKVSVSLPDALTRSVRDRVGRGRFSAYVTVAVERQLELDRLAELVDGFEERLGRPISDDLMAEAEAAWHAE